MKDKFNFAIQINFEILHPLILWENGNTFLFIIIIVVILQA